MPGETTAAPADARKLPFPPEFLAEVRARTPLVSLIGRDVRLAHKGGVWSGLCPFHGERRPSFAVYPDHYHCFSCGVHGDAIRYVMETSRVPFVEAVNELAAAAGMIAAKSGQSPRAPLQPLQPPAPDAARRNHAAATTIFLAARPIPDTPVEAYLKNRKVDLRHLGHAPGALRFHPGLFHAATGSYFPAMVAAVNSPEGKHVSTHRTWLQRAGDIWIKARLHDNKMVLGTHPGGSIHLWKGASGKKLKDAPEHEPVVIAEGIETALSIVMAAPEMRVLCGLNQGNMGGVWLPPQIRTVILALDNDASVDNGKTEEKRIKAALATSRMINRWFDRGYTDVRFIQSPHGKDFNDALQ
jgi:hypothetical protein